MKKQISLLLATLLLTLSLVGCNNDEEEWEKMVREYRENKMTKYREENEKYDDFEVDAAFLGDSLTDGYDLEKHYPSYVVSNRGIGGDTTFGLEDRLDTSLYDLQPKVALMLIGVNNIDSMFENYENILKGFKEKAPDTRIILLSLTSMSGEWGKNNQLAAYNNVRIKMLAEKYSFSYVDLYSALFNLETGEIYSEYTIDGCHLTAEGYEALTEAIMPVLEEELSLWHSQNN